MNKKSLFSKTNIVLVICILLCFATSLYWGYKKEGFHGDELYSYAFICSTDEPSVNWGTEEEPYLNEWHTPEYFYDFYTITPEEKYDVWGVFRVIKGDDHPFRFYLLLELLISTISLNSFSKWLGISINLFFLVLTLIALYILAYKLLKSKAWAMLVMSFYGFSVGCVSNCIYIRMYMILAFATVFYSLMLYLILEQGLSESASKWKKYVFLLLHAFAIYYGMTTQCQFAIYCGFLGFLVFFLILFKKKWKFLLEYTISVILGLLMTAYVWPETYHDIFAGDDATETAFVDLIFNEFPIANLKNFWNVIDAQMFSGYGIILWGAIIIILVSACVVFKRAKSYQDRKETLKWFFVLFSIVTICLVLFVLAKIAPMQIDRYVFNLYPMIAVVMLFLLKSGLDVLVQSIKWKNLLFAVTVLCCLGIIIVGYVKVGVDYTFIGEAAKVEYMQNSSDIPVVMITEDNRRFFSCVNSYYVKDSDKVFPVKLEDLDEQFPKINFEVKSHDRAIVFIDENLPSHEDILRQFEKGTNLSNAEELFVNDMATAYLVSGEIDEK